MPEVLVKPKQPKGIKKVSSLLQGSIPRNDPQIEEIARAMGTSPKKLSSYYKTKKAPESVSATGEVKVRSDALEIFTEKLNELQMAPLVGKRGFIDERGINDFGQADALEILEKAAAKNVQIHLPVDVVAADAFSNDATTQIVDVTKIPDGWQGLDAGPTSQVIFDKVVNSCKTILWNGPLGVFELETFSKGTIALGNSIDRATQNGAFALVGGGDSVAAVKQFGFADKVSYVSTGGGAMLETLEGKTLPGIKAILS